MLNPQLKNLVCTTMPRPPFRGQGAIRPVRSRLARGEEISKDHDRATEHLRYGRQACGIRRGQPDHCGGDKRQSPMVLGAWPGCVSPIPPRWRLGTALGPSSIGARGWFAPGAAGRYGGEQGQEVARVKCARSPLLPRVSCPGRPSMARLSLLRQPRGDLVVPNVPQRPSRPRAWPPDGGKEVGAPLTRRTHQELAP
jgi:hypothetical protein